MLESIKNKATAIGTFCWKYRKALVEVVASVAVDFIPLSDVIEEPAKKVLRKATAATFCAAFNILTRNETNVTTSQKIAMVSSGVALVGAVTAISLGAATSTVLLISSFVTVATVLVKLVPIVSAMLNRQPITLDMVI